MMMLKIHSCVYWKLAKQVSIDIIYTKSIEQTQNFQDILARMDYIKKLIRKHKNTIRLFMPKLNITIYLTIAMPDNGKRLV